MYLPLIYPFKKTHFWGSQPHSKLSKASDWDYAKHVETQENHQVFLSDLTWLDTIDINWLPSRKLTYPKMPRHCWRWFSFSLRWYMLGSLEGYTILGLWSLTQLLVGLFSEADRPHVKTCPRLQMMKVLHLIKVPSRRNPCRPEGCCKYVFVLPRVWFFFRAKRRNCGVAPCLGAGYGMY